MTRERADDHDRADAASAEPQQRPTDLRSLLAQGPLRSPAFEETPSSDSVADAVASSSDDGTVVDPAFESERTGRWPRSPITSASASATSPPPATEDGSSTDASASAVIERSHPSRRRKAAWVVSAASVVLVSIYAVSRPTPTQIAIDAEASRTRPMGEHVVQGREGVPLEGRRAMPSATREPRVEVADPLELGEPEMDDEEVLEIDEAEVAELEAARRAAIAARRAQAEARRLAERATEALEAGRRTDAIPLLERALELHPALASAAADLCVAYFDEGEFALAVSFGERAVALESSNPEHHVVLGDAYYRVERRVEAKKHWAIARDLGSDRAEKRIEKLGS